MSSEDQQIQTGPLDGHSLSIPVMVCQECAIYQWNQVRFASLILGASCLKTNLAAFCPMLRALVAEEAKVLGFPICEGGTVVTIQGPRLTIVNITTGKDRNSHHRFSSKAESHMFRLWGADVVNMTTVPEVQSGCEHIITSLRLCWPRRLGCPMQRLLCQLTTTAGKRDRSSM